MNEKGYYVIQFGTPPKTKRLANFYKRRPTERPGFKIIKGPLKSLKDAALASDPSKLYLWILNQCVEHGYIRENGKRKKLSRKEAAELIGVTHLHLSDILRGKAVAHRRHARLLALELNQREQGPKGSVGRFLLLTKT